MRKIINKRISTKAERIFHELLKESKTPFEFKIKLGGREIDFLIGKYAIEIDGHEQFEGKNELLIELGYVPIHFSNEEIYKSRDKIKRIIKNDFNEIKFKRFSE